MVDVLDEGSLTAILSQGDTATEAASRQRLEDSAVDVDDIALVDRLVREDIRTTHRLQREWLEEAAEGGHIR